MVSEVLLCARKPKHHPAEPGLWRSLGVSVSGHISLQLTPSWVAVPCPAAGQPGLGLPGQSLAPWQYP